jgi:predicted phage terminase large subunit-like protein
MSSLSVAELQDILDNIDDYSEEQINEILGIVNTIDAVATYDNARNDLLTFVQYMSPDYIVGKHHKILATLLTQLEAGEKDRIAVSVAPRHGKSLLISTYYPAWYLGRNPSKMVMLVSHTADLAVDFSRKVRNMFLQDTYRDVFPEVTIAADSKAAGRWNTDQGGGLYATGVGAALAGRGADLLLVDDPHNEQDILNGNLSVFKKAYEWFRFGARTRLMKGGRVAIVHTRWHSLDLIGQLVRDAAADSKADQYEVFEFPAIMEVERDGQLEERALWPEMFPLEELHRTKASMPAFQWNAQYQQSPTAEEAAIVKREWFRVWTKEEPPDCEFLISTLDAAAEAKTRSDFTALSTWGVWFNEEENRHAVILLNAVKQRLEYPELKDLAREHYKEWAPDSFIVEKKSSGTPLFQELRRAGIMVSEYTPHRGTGDKVARLNSVADIFRDGLVWVPTTRWADELVEEVVSFPFAPNDDQVDTTIMALMRFRQGGFIALSSDESDTDVGFIDPRHARRQYY